MNRGNTMWMTSSSKCPPEVCGHEFKNRASQHGYVSISGLFSCLGAGVRQADNWVCPGLWFSQRRRREKLPSGFCEHPRK